MFLIRNQFNFVVQWVVYPFLLIGQYFSMFGAILWRYSKIVFTFLSFRLPPTDQIDEKRKQMHFPNFCAISNANSETDWSSKQPWCICVYAHAHTHTTHSIILLCIVCCSNDNRKWCIVRFIFSCPIISAGNVST